MVGQNIVCFAKDWTTDPTSCHHVMIELAKRNRVLWLNSIAMRTPNLKSGRDLRKIWNKLASIGAPRNVQDDLWVYTPLVLPLPYSKVAIRINQAILAVTLRALRARLGMREFQLWTFLPNVAEYVGKLGESLLVYYCVDEWSKFTYIEGQKMSDLEAKIAPKADIVFATSRSLADKQRRMNPETCLSNHGVDHELFAAALDPATVVPDDLAALPQPVIGYYGAVQDWLDLDLIEHLARRHPEWSIALIGEVFVDVSRFQRYPNVHLLGRKPHADLPRYCKGFSVGLVPHKVNELTLHMNPIKLREYLSAGLPVVSTALPEATYYRDHLAMVANDFEEFERGVEEGLRETSSAIKRARSDAMKVETWERKVEVIGSEVMRVADRKNSR